VREAVTNNNWLRNFNFQASFTANIHEFVQLWTAIEALHLEPNIPDDIRWKFTGDGNYFAASAYKALLAHRITGLGE